jgi:hypothetical protein
VAGFARYVAVSDVSAGADDRESITDEGEDAGQRAAQSSQRVDRRRRGGLKREDRPTLVERTELDI